MANGDTWKKIAIPLLIAAFLAAAGLYGTVTVLKERDTTKAEKIETNKASIKENEDSIEGVEDDISEIKFEQQAIRFEQQVQRTTMENIDGNVKRILDKLDNSP